MKLFAGYKLISLSAIASLLAGCVSGYFGLLRAQDPQNRPYLIETVTIPSEANVKLAGKLTMPQGEGPFRAIVLVAGSFMLSHCCFVI